LVRDLLETQTVKEGVGQPNRGRTTGKEAKGGIAGRIGIDQKHASIEVRERRRQINGGCAFAHPPFGIGNREASHDLPPSPACAVALHLLEVTISLNLIGRTMVPR
jgi:hypothetical protein